ncbi:hypothetical protein BON22_1952 [Cyberlindnera fabianii]|uniref:Pro-apoptotic serine protease NMA111 n=1 Tax=Cyberlindnera fabianii TaxID=36022 RepID=A0A1V2LB79_CYBFA|nr:hypothetical protein BON22_1952 [Cyberlindnera fabianii]
MSTKRPLPVAEVELSNGDAKRPALELTDDIPMEDLSDGDVEIIEQEEDIQAPIPLLSDSVTSGKWGTTIANVVKSVVSIHFAQTANFDCDSALVSEATGFVVDAEQGIILTNRHVVGAGPFWGFAVFDNHEECDVKPVYRDPVHDFGFLKFDPKKIKYMQVQALELRPDLATVGCEIRVVGNDAGEKLSILSGFISRLDRNAPDYGLLTYNDFNTEYIQAAASASGGSSGSPVVNVDGYAVALQAGGSSEASTDFFLPLYRVARALKCIQNGEAVTRGSIQVQWILRPYDECRRLGLSDEAEKKARGDFPKSIGLLVAEVILPEGPADGLIEEGDTLISINGKSIVTFITVDDILDSSVGQDIEIVLQRGGENIVVQCKVGNLHDITPNRYLEVAGASFNDLSYQMAIGYAIPVKGVFVNNASGSFYFNGDHTLGWIIDTVNDVDVSNLDEFIEVMKAIPDRSRITVTYRHISDLHTPNVSTIYIERHWCSTFRLATRNDETGLWDFTELPDALPPVPTVSKAVKFVDIPSEYPGCAALSRSFVLVKSYLHMPADSYPAIRRDGYGVVIDSEKGYVLVSRMIVPHDCIDIQITVADSHYIPAEVVFLHPTQNYAVIKYDPSLVQGDVRTPKFSDTRLKRGDKCTFIGYNYNFRLLTTDTHVSNISTVNVPKNPTAPRYRGTNLEAVYIATNLCDSCGSGVIADSDGTIRALWMSFLGGQHNDGDTFYKMGIDVTEVNSVIKSLQNGVVPNVKIVDAEFSAIHIDQARIMGVSDEWVTKVEDAERDRMQFMAVSRAAVPVDQHKPELEAGDIVLTVNDELVHDTMDLRRHCEGDSLTMRIVRRKKELEVVVPLVHIESTDHIVIWSGVIIQAPHHAIRQSMVNLPSQVYVTGRARGSPAAAFDINPTNFITHVNGKATPTLEEFVKVVRTIGDDTYCKIRLVSFDNVPFAISVKTNYHYFPTGEVKREVETGKWLDIEYNEKNEESTVKKI